MKQILRTLDFYLDLLRREDLLCGSVPEGADLTRPVDTVTCDSRRVEGATLFICKGAHFSPVYLEQAAAHGAFFYLSETAYPDSPIPGVQVRDVLRVMALLAPEYFGHPAEELTVAGITGTKGKSTTAYYLESIFSRWQAAEGLPPCGLISSIDTFDGVERFESHNTTPEPLDLQRHFRHAADAGLRRVVMEVSSQALKYHRVDGVRFAAAAFLNIGEDHISPAEHTDFEDYFSSKLKIFAQTEAACVNLDCDRAGRILQAAKDAGCRVLTFSRRDPAADLFADRIRSTGRGLAFCLHTAEGERELTLDMPGEFNVENALAAAGICRILGVPEDFVAEGLARAHAAGRMELFSSPDGERLALVDYAHNRLSFETLFSALRAQYPKHRLVAVYGCPGGKAYARRRELTEVTARYADLSILTEEDPADEDPAAIAEEMAGYLTAAGGVCAVEPDRGKAIRQAILSGEGPVLAVITGKGRETRQHRGQAFEEVPSDVEYVEQALRLYEVETSARAAEPAEVRGHV